MVTLTFISSFRSHYLRNNRGSGKKNIRCFPRCTRRGPGGHVSKGFCGNLIHVKAGGLAAEDTVLLQIRPRVTPAYVLLPTPSSLILALTLLFSFKLSQTNAQRAKFIGHQNSKYLFRDRAAKMVRGTSMYGADLRPIKQRPLRRRFLL